MPTDFTFRLSTYLTLGLACVCISYSEWDLLPEVTLFTVGVIILLLISFLTEDRFELNIKQANRIGFFIGLLTMAWLGWQFVRPSGGLMYVLPWPTSLLPYLGPLLMVLMPAKLFRPKHRGDWWAMHGIALVAVGLACAITDDVFFGVLLALYLLCGVWSVSLLFLRVWAGEVPPIPGQETDTTPKVVNRTAITSQGYFIRGLRWTVLAVAFALPMFFLTPPSPAGPWQLGSRKIMETGLPSEQMLDLNRSGELRVSRDVVLEVEATLRNGSPKLDLSPSTLWRAAIYTDYEKGRWTPSRSLYLFSIRESFRGNSSLPDLGPQQYTLEYYPTPRLNREVIAEPIIWQPGQAAPVASVGLWQSKLWKQMPDGSFVSLSAGTGRIGRYRQVSRPVANPEYSPMYELAPPVFLGRGGAQAMVSLQSARLPRLRAWANEKLEEMVAENILPRTVLERAEVDQVTGGLVIDKEDYEIVGRAFSLYFSRSKDFRYDLRLPRLRQNIDPIEDFVLNSRVGHCERFASALALTLRTLSVPSVLMMGYKGAEQEEEGRYVIRQEHAHAWVAILVSKPTPPDYIPVDLENGDKPDLPDEVWQWLTLDPTPGFDGSDNDDELGWLSTAGKVSRSLFRDFIINYDAERRQRVVVSLKRHFIENRIYYTAGIVALFAFFVSLWLIPKPALFGQAEVDPIHGPQWYQSLLAELEKAGYPIRPGETPKEFAQRCEKSLSEDPSGCDLAHVPREIVEALYRSSYGGEELSPAETDKLTSRIEELAGRLKDGERQPKT